MTPGYLAVGIVVAVTIIGVGFIVALRSESREYRAAVRRSFGNESWGDG